MGEAGRQNSEAGGRDSLKLANGHSGARFAEADCSDRGIISERLRAPLFAPEQIIPPYSAYGKNLLQSVFVNRLV